MKKTIRFTVIAGMLAISLISLIGCGDASQKHVEDAKGNIQEAGKDLGEAAKAANEEAKAKATADWQQFRHESDSTVAAMEKEIKLLKERIAKEDKVAREKLNSDLNKAETKLNAQKEKLRQKGLEFESDLIRFDESMVARTDRFMREYKYDMDALGAALKDLFKDNVK